MARLVSLLLLAGALCSAVASPVTFRDGVYDGFVVTITEDIPASECSAILSNLEVAISAASTTLRTALDGRASLGETIIVLPDTWPDACVPPMPGRNPDEPMTHIITPSLGEKGDIEVQRIDPAYNALLFTQQSRGCGQPGDKIHLSHTLLEEPVAELGKRLAREIAKYRYGVFDEIGFDRDPVYPTCYLGSQTDRLSLTGCSDLPLDGDHGACQRSANPNLTQLVQPSARASLMFAPGLPNVDHFCDASTHDRLGPTKQNAMCNRRSVMEVINAHADFKAPADGSAPPANPQPRAPTFVYKRPMMTRYVLIVENTNDMAIRDSWVFLRTAIRKWAYMDLPVNTEVGLVLVNDSTVSRLLPLQALNTQAERAHVSSNIPFSPGDSHASACLECGLRDAIDMLTERAQTGGPSNNVVIILAPGTDRPKALLAAAREAADQKIYVSTINYPGVLRSAALDPVGIMTTAPVFTVYEKGYNVVNSMVSTYFRLSTALTDITHNFYEGQYRNLPVEVHRREVTDKSTDSGTFMLEHGLGAPARFAIYTHNTENPLIRAITLTSPTGRIYTLLSDTLMSLRMITVSANINETGTWQYSIDRYNGNPQSHFVQVVATPWSALTPVVRARFFTSTGPGPLVLYVHVTWGDAPVLGASVEVTAYRPAIPGHGVNGTTVPSYTEKLVLLDSGGGDPDITRGDGVYSRYFSTLKGGAGLYTFEAQVTDNGNTAYSWRENRHEEHDEIQGFGSCCGSVLRTPAVKILDPFQRVPGVITIPLEDAPTVQSRTVFPPGRVGDLRAEVIGMDTKARLTWTAPDIGGLTVARYEVKYALKLSDLIESFDTLATSWDHGSTPFALAPGSDSSYTMDLSREPGLLDTPFFVALRAFPDADSGMAPGPVSNVARVFVPTPPPPPPPTAPPTGSPDVSLWPLDDGEGDSPVPRLAAGLDIGLDLILPVVGGVLALAICLGVYCYVCGTRRDSNGGGKAHGHGQPVKSPGGMSPGSLVVTPQSPHSPQHAPLAGPDGSPGLDHKKRLSLEDPMSMHQDMCHPHPVSAPHSPHHGIAPAPLGSPVGVGGVGHTGSLQRPRTLSPYQSWTASQLLHEHERRHSPYGDEQALPAYQGYQYQYQQHQQHAVDGMEQQYDPQYYPEQHFHQAPPVPPLPHLRYSEEVYGVQTQPPQPPQPQVQQQTHGFLHSNRLLPFNPSLQGSLSSVSSGDRKKRNVTMV